MAEERLQKFLAAAGVASRRKAEALIVSGRVKVNQVTVTELGTKVNPGRDLVTVDNALVSMPEEKSYHLLYKPAGCVTTASDPQGRPTAFEYLQNVKARLFPVGRLDYDAEGAILFTNDGELANRLAHPRYGHRRVYLVKVKGDPDAEALERMKSGVRLEDGPAQAIDVAVHEHADKNVWIRVVVGEGRYHLVKRLCEAVGLYVLRLFRPEFGGVTVDGLRAGQHRPLTDQEVESMRRLVGLSEGKPMTAVLPRELPKAARRHGHGPPAPPRPRDNAKPTPGGFRDRFRAEKEAGRTGRPASEPRPERDDREGGDERPERAERDDLRPGARADRSDRPDRPPRREDARAGHEDRSPPREERRPGADDRGPRREDRSGRDDRRPPRGDDRPGREDRRASRDERPPARAARGPRGDDRRAGSAGPDRRPGSARPERGGRAASAPPRGRPEPAEGGRGGRGGRPPAGKRPAGAARPSGDDRPRFPRSDRGKRSR